MAAAKGKTGAAQKASGSGEKGRMVHIRLEPELHRKLRLVVAAQDTTLQDWIARTLEDAANKTWASVGQGGEQ
jgi:predicted HicB family RNase H-like nuclease